MLRPKSTAKELLRELCDAERSCIIEYGTEYDMLTDAELGELVGISTQTTRQYRWVVGVPSLNRRLAAYRLERAAKNGD